MVAFFYSPISRVIYFFMESEEKNANIGGEDKSMSAKKNMKIFFAGFAGLIGVVLVLSGIVGIYRTYALAATDNFTLAIAKVLRLPVAKIGSTVALYTDYADDLHAIKTMRDYDKANNGPGANFTDEEMSDQVLLRIANNVLLDQEATSYGVTVEQSDIDALKTTLMQQFENVDKLNEELGKRYGWTLVDYEKKVMRSYILQNKLNEKIATDDKLKEEVKAQAQSVLDQIKGGADFAELATQYGQDGTKDQGGDLGFFKKGEMVPEFETAAFALNEGDVAQELVETEYGYHIIKVEEKKTEDVVNPDTKKKEKVESVHARHILFRYPSVDVFLGDLAKKTNFHLYVKVHNPFTDLNK